MKLNKANVEQILPLTTMQEGMLFHFLNNEEHNGKYHEQLVIELKGDLEYEYFSKAWEYVITSNKMLMTVFIWDKIENPVQVVLKKQELPLTFLDIRDSLTYSESINKIKQKDIENINLN
ncbi:condensation domain-containing protein, partial [Paenibacillus sp. P3E]|uniref:condensation domain-containing protein n=1 Tax=Paenibacillus sp. P3E TaxID=1349435 RepID=UPI000B007E14